MESQEVVGDHTTLAQEAVSLMGFLGPGLVID
jgi:uncharacterized membrane protein YhiD involved in acid resistance